MRILRYKNGSVIVDKEHPDHSATINGQAPDEILPFTEHNLKKYTGLDATKLRQEEHDFHQLQKRSKKG